MVMLKKNLPKRDMRPKTHPFWAFQKFNLKPILNAASIGGLTSTDANPISLTKLQ